MAITVVANGFNLVVPRIIVRAIDAFGGQQPVIFFINAGAITPTGSMDHALEMLMHGKRES